MRASIEEGIIVVLAVVEDADTGALSGILSTVLDYCLEAGALWHIDGNGATQLLGQHKELGLPAVEVGRVHVAAVGLHVALNHLGLLEGLALFVADDVHGSLAQGVGVLGLKL